jgi:hypothetical protein
MGPQLALPFSDPEVSRLHEAMDTTAEREGQLRTFFAQRGIKPDEVAAEINESEPVLGDPRAVERFLANAVQRFGGELRPAKKAGVYELHPGAFREQLASAGAFDFPLRVTFDRLIDEIAEELGRTHPIVAVYCDAVFGAALEGSGADGFARCGAMYTSAVTVRTGVLLLRVRYRLREQIEQFAEEVVLVAFRREDGKLSWLTPLDRAAVDLLSEAQPTANMSQSERAEQVEWALNFVQGHTDWYEPIIEERVQTLQESHSRLRKLTKSPRLNVIPHTPPDILGCWVLVPAGGR